MSAGSAKNSGLAAVALAVLTAVLGGLSATVSSLPIRIAMIVVAIGALAAAGALIGLAAAAQKKSET